MYKDIKGRTGYRNMQGHVYLYGDLKLLTPSELTEALSDGITPFVKPARPQPTVAQTIEKVVKDIKDYRDFLNTNGGVKVGAKWFHSDPISQLQQLTLNTLGPGIPANIQWKTMNGSRILMNQAKAASVVSAQVIQNLTIFNKAEEHIAAISLLSDNDSINSYDWKDGFPAIYEG